MTPPTTVRYVKLHPEGRVPARQTDGSAGFDLALPYDTTLDARPKAIPLGFAMQMPPGYEAQIRPRSGLTLDGVHVMLGTVDSDYRGEVGVVAWTWRPDGSYFLPEGTRVAQLVFAYAADVVLHEVEALSDTERGDGGFGSTGRA